MLGSSCVLLHCLCSSCVSATAAHESQCPTILRHVPCCSGHGSGGGGGSFGSRGGFGTPDLRRDLNDYSAVAGPTYGEQLTLFFEAVPLMGSGGGGVLWASLCFCGLTARCQGGGPGHPSESTCPTQRGGHGGGSIQIAARLVQNAVWDMMQSGSVGGRDPLCRAPSPPMARTVLQTRPHATGLTTIPKVCSLRLHACMHLHSRKWDSWRRGRRERRSDPDPHHVT